MTLNPHDTYPRDSYPPIYPPTSRKGKSEHERPGGNNYGKNTRHNKWSCRGTK